MTCLKYCSHTFHRSAMFNDRKCYKYNKTFYQSKIRPTNGEIKVTPASAQATAWQKENSSVRLQ